MLFALYTTYDDSGWIGYRSSNFGDTWEPIYDAELPVDSIPDAVAAIDELMIVCWRPGTGGKLTRLSVDDGDTWQTIDNPTDDYLGVVYHFGEELQPIGSDCIIWSYSDSTQWQCVKWERGATAWEDISAKWIWVDDSGTWTHFLGPGSQFSPAVHSSADDALWVIGGWGEREGAPLPPLEEDPYWGHVLAYSSDRGATWDIRRRPTANWVIDGDPAPYSFQPDHAKEWIHNSSDNLWYGLSWAYGTGTGYRLQVWDSANDTWDEIELISSKHGAVYTYSCTLAAKESNILILGQTPVDVPPIAYVGNKSNGFVELTTSGLPADSVGVGNDGSKIAPSYIDQGLRSYGPYWFYGSTNETGFLYRSLDGEIWETVLDVDKMFGRSNWLGGPVFAGYSKPATGIATKSTTIYQPNLVRWNHRFLGVKESLKINQEVGQYFYDLHRLDKMANDNTSSWAEDVSAIQEDLNTLSARIEELRRRTYSIDMQYGFTSVIVSPPEMEM